MGQETWLWHKVQPDLDWAQGLQADRDWSAPPSNSDSTLHFHTTVQENINLKIITISEDQTDYLSKMRQKLWSASRVCLKVSLAYRSSGLPFSIHKTEKLWRFDLCIVTFKRFKLQWRLSQTETLNRVSVWLTRSTYLLSHHWGPIIVKPQRILVCSTPRAQSYSRAVLWGYFTTPSYHVMGG